MDLKIYFSFRRSTSMVKDTFECGSDQPFQENMSSFTGYLALSQIGMFYNGAAHGVSIL